MTTMSNAQQRFADGTRVQVAWATGIVEYGVVDGSHVEPIDGAVFHTLRLDDRTYCTTRPCDVVTAES